MTSHEYWKQVDGIVSDLIEEGQADKLDTDELTERLHETIDGHEWVIYTGYHYEVLQHSPNDGYSVENFGADSIVKDGVLDTAALAYGALYGDVSERLYRRIEDCSCADVGTNDCSQCHDLGWFDAEAAA